eukprot:6364733-Amphidinium_carterae.2
MLNWRVVRMQAEDRLCNICKCCQQLSLCQDTVVVGQEVSKMATRAIFQQDENFLLQKGPSNPAANCRRLKSSGGGGSNGGSRRP